MNKVRKKLVFENVSFAYKKNNFVLRNLSFEISSTDSSGFVTSVLGESGSGKSTMLKLILGIEKNFIGNITTVPEKPIISYVPQEAVLFEHLTPMQNARYFEKLSNYRSKFDIELFEQVSTILELDDILKKSKSVLELSGGQRQKLSLLRALSIKPDFLLLDEPCTGLDADVKKMFLLELREIIVEYDLLVVYVTHHKIEATLIADEILYIIKDRRLNAVREVFQENTQSFLNQPPVLEAAVVFGFPEVNVLFCEIDSDKNILPKNGNSSDDEHESSFYLTFQSDIIIFSNKSGFAFEIIIQTPVYTIIRLKDSNNVLTLKTKKMDTSYFSSKLYIQLTGNVVLYSFNKLFLGKVEVKKNKLIQ